METADVHVRGGVANILDLLGEKNPGLSNKFEGNYALSDCV